MSKRKAVAPAKVESIETFRDVRGYSLHSLMAHEPSCFNGYVCIRKYRVTVEEIDEPNEVLAARLQGLWDRADNHHHMRPLKAVAAQLGYELTGEFGNSRERRKP